MEIFELTSENLSGLGGPMGSERTTINYVMPFADKQAAIEYAENEYGEMISWERKSDYLCSGDLSYVMYTIRKKKVIGSEDIRPKMLDDKKINLESLKETCEEYIEHIYSEKYHEDNDYDHFIFETAMTTLYGENVFDIINKKTSSHD